MAKMNWESARVRERAARRRNDAYSAASERVVYSRPGAEEYGDAAAVELRALMRKMRGDSEPE